MARSASHKPEPKIERYTSFFHLYDKCQPPVTSTSYTMASSEYKLLRQQDSDMEESLLSDSLPKQPPRLYRAAYTLLMVLFFISLFFNAIWVIQQRQNPLESIDATPTLYGELQVPRLPLAAMTLKVFHSGTLEEPGGPIHDRHNVY